MAWASQLPPGYSIEWEPTSPEDPNPRVDGAPPLPAPAGDHSWLILDRFVHYSRRRQGIFEGDGTTSSVRVSLRIADPPAVRDAEHTRLPGATAIARPPQLHPLPYDRPFDNHNWWHATPSFPVDYFVYSCSSPSSSPSLTWLPPCFYGGDNDPVLDKFVQQHRRQQQRIMFNAEMGILCHGGQWRNASRWHTSVTTSSSSACCTICRRQDVPMAWSLKEAKDPSGHEDRSQLRGQPNDQLLHGVRLPAQALKYRRLYNENVKNEQGSSALPSTGAKGKELAEPTRIRIGLSESVKRQFWEDLDGMVSTVPISEKLFIGGDLNGHLVVTDFRLRVHVHQDKCSKMARTKWWKLREEGPWGEGEDVDDMWLKMATCVRKVAAEVLGVSRGGKQEGKDTWWWNEEVQRAIKEKKEWFKRLHLDRSAANIEGYKVAKKAAKRARKTRDINQIKCIKDETDQLLVKDEEIKDRWREYFDKLFNGEIEGPALELDDSFDDINRCFVRRIQEAEIGEALKRMKGGKAMGPDGIPIEDRPTSRVPDLLRPRRRRSPLAGASRAATAVVDPVSGHPRPRDLAQTNQGEPLSFSPHFPGPVSPPFGRRNHAGEPRDPFYELVPAAEEIAQESEVNVVHVDPSPEQEYRFEPEGKPRSIT
ncbi:hypothetical protein HU200_034766 [Digitaria exilis]|uniref:Uncharacterized protein n=1 Tax=Digitaria exilis TaxID=1010633 RepID=A0A835BGB1_9POAL|nr:hypothetical protein HU200_034766 [Digitaria exilis]